MKVVILAGGAQSTINDEYEGIPKPMVEVGGRPLLWHIMKHFSQYDINDFIVCGGFRLDLIKQYFTDYYIYESDITVDLETNIIKIHEKKTENWKVTVVDTGLYSSPGERIRLAKEYIKGDTFIVTYGDCLYDIDIRALIDNHKKNRKMATISMAKPVGRNELLPLDNNGKLCYDLKNENEKNESWINANCFVFNKKIFEYIEKNNDLEHQFLINLSKEDKISTYPHYGYWRAVETKRDLTSVEELWKKKQAPWIRREY